MAANSKHWLDINKWLYDVIDSCKTIQQLLSAQKLLRLFEKRYPYKGPYDYMFKIHYCLNDYWDYKFKSLSYIKENL